MKTLAVVPARAGSRGVPGKNKRDFMGKPLVSWAIEVGQRTCNRVSVTSDDPDILRIAQGYGVQAIDRPKDLAMDETPMVYPLVHALACQAEPADLVVLLQPTQPLRTDAQVKAALALIEENDEADSVVSVVEVPQHMSPDYVVRITGGWLNVPSWPPRRQLTRTRYYRDGTVYVMRAERLITGDIYGHSVLPLVLKESESCSIDTEDDWARAEYLYRRQHGSAQVVS